MSSSSTIHSLFLEQLTEEEIAAILKGLQAQGYIAVEDTKVTYAIPPSGS